MEAFLQQNKPLIFSTLFLFFAIHVFLHTVYGGYQRLSAHNAEVIRSEVSRRNIELRKSIKTLVVQKKSEREGPNSTPAFLARINRLARENGIKILQIAADQQTNSSFQIRTTADFRAFLRFLAAVEGFDVELLKLEIAPAETESKSADRKIRLSISPRDSGAVPNPERVAAIREQAEALSGAAFSPGGASAARNGGESRRRVSGITEINGDLIATVDNIDYAVGDEIDGWVITDITREGVVLSHPAKKKRRNRVLTLR